MTITTDRAAASLRPNRWHIRQLLMGALAVGLPFLALTLGIYWVGGSVLGLTAPQLQTLAFVTLVFGCQVTVYLVREPRRAWTSRPGGWLVVATATVVVGVVVLAGAGWLMAALDPRLLVGVLAVVVLWAVLVVDSVKVSLFPRLGLHTL